MKILFVLENTIADLRGGTEVSSWHLASLLRKKGCEIEEWVPYFRRKSQFWYTNLVGQVYIFIKLILFLIRNKPDVIHIQGKYLIPPATAAGKLLRIPTVVTIRDYIVVCPIGLCLFETFRGQSSRHNFGWYVTMEIPRFLSIYHPTESRFKKVIRTGLMIRGWFISKYLKLWLKQVDKVIAVSKATQRILKENGIKSRVVYNSFDSGLYKDRPLLIKDGPLGKEKKTILFVGKPSYGKGYDLFLSLSRNELFGNYEFKIIGGVNKLPYLETLQKIRDAAVVVIPSRWPEPFGRVALESLLMGTPVLTSSRGGLAEIVEDGRDSIVIKDRQANEEKWSLALVELFHNRDKLKRNISQKMKQYLQRFSTEPASRHIHLYKRLLVN